MKKVWNNPELENLEISETNCGGTNKIDGICTKDVKAIPTNPPVVKS